MPISSSTIFGEAACAGSTAHSHTLIARSEEGARRLQPEVLVGPPRRCPPPWRPLQQPLLQQIRLIDVLEGVGLLVDRDGQRRQPDRAAGELPADRAEDLAVEAVEAEVVDLEQRERAVGGRVVDDAGATD